MQNLKSRAERSIAEKQGYTADSSKIKENCEAAFKGLSAIRLDHKAASKTLKSLRGK